MWVFDWLTTSFSSFLGRTFQKKLNFCRIRQYEGEHAHCSGRLTYSLLPISGLSA